MAQTDVHHIFDRFARHYDMGWLQKALYAALQDRALAELRPLRPAAVLDVGCGTGIFAGRLADELAPTVVSGCDLSGGMLAEAAARTRRVGWVRGDAGRLPIRDGAVDAVVCTQAFHFFDHPQALAEFRRVLGPGGHVLIGMINPKTPAASARLSRLIGAVGKLRATWPTGRQIRGLLGEAGFEVTGQYNVPWAVGRLMPVLLTVGRAQEVPR